MMLYLQDRVQKELLPAVNEGRRFTKSANTLKTSLFKETYTGCSVIRAFGMEQSFYACCEQALETDLLYNQMWTSVHEYQQFRMSQIKSLVLAVCFLFCINQRNTVDIVTLTVLINQMLNISKLLKNLVKMKMQLVQ